MSIPDHVEKRPSQREFLGLAFPNVLSNLTVPLAGLIDLAILGHLDDITPLAGVALAGLIFDYAYWGFGFLRMGTVGPTAKALGAKDDLAIARAFCRPFLIAIVAGTLLMACQQPLAWVGFGLLDGSASVEAAGKDYYFARIWGAPATLAGYVVTGWFIGRQQPRAALVHAAVLNGLNILLDYWFIYELGWGARGAGLATMIAEVSAFCMAMIIMKRMWRGLPRITIDLVLGGSGWKKFFSLQTHILIRTFCLISTLSIFTNLSAGFGAVILAANTINLRLMNTVAYLVDGFSYALESLAGKYSGQGSLAAVQRALKQGLAWNGVVTALFIVLFLFYGEPILRIMTSHEAVIDTATNFLPFVCLALIFGGAAYIFDGFFIGLAAGKLLSRNMTAALLVGFLPFAALSIWLKLPWLLWMGMAGFMFVRMVSLGRYAFHVQKRAFATGESYE